MSDNWIALIPEDSQFVPAIHRREAARERFAAIAPNADEIKIMVNHRIQFFDCGANLEKIVCPACGEEVSFDWWQERMDEDYKEEGFKLEEYLLPCCGAASTLALLKYHWPQGFARFGIDAMNTGIGEMSEEQRCEFERILETPLLVIYQRI